MATSAKYLKAIAMKKVVARKRTAGEVQIVFPVRADGTQPKSVCLHSFDAIDLLSRVDVTLDDIKRSNLDNLVARGAVELVL